jgi:predicted transcriptional regulator
MKSASTLVPTRNFHLPLPEPVYRALQEAAAAVKRPATAVAREAIEGWLRERRKSVLRETIATYALEHAGTGADIDPALEEAGLEVLRPRSSRQRRR